MLTPEQQREFEQSGILRLPGAVPRADAEAMCEALWEVLEHRHRILRRDPSTWNGKRLTGTNPVPTSMTFPQLGSAAARVAMDDLLGAGKWQEPDRWGSLLVSFPDSREPWDLPHQSWHLDFPAEASMGEQFGVRMFTCLAPLRAGGGATLGVAGSARLVQHLIAAGGHYRSADVRKTLIRKHAWLKALCSPGEKDRVERFMNASATVEGVEVRVVEFTGEVGDVVLMHPWTLHDASKNCSADPRMVLSSTVYRVGVEPAALYRAA